MSDKVWLYVLGDTMGMIYNWTGVTIEFAIDNCADGFSISAPFDSTRQEAQHFKPFHYPLCQLFIGDELILTGRIEKVELSDSADGQTVNVQGRSKPGVLVDCYIDEVGYQYKGPLTLIIQGVIAKYGIAIWVEDPTDKIHTDRMECAAEPGQKVFDFIVKLAEGCRRFLSSDKEGRLVISEPPKAEIPVASIIAGESPYIGGSASYDGTARFSSYKLIVQDFGMKPLHGFATDDDMPKRVYRHSVELAETTLTDRTAAWEEICDTAKHKRALAFARAASINITVSGWRDALGALWKKGSTITLKAPALMIKRESTFVLAGVSLKIDESQGRVADLRLVMPQTFQDVMPGVYPWD